MIVTVKCSVFSFGILLMSFLLLSSGRREDDRCGSLRSASLCLGQQNQTGKPVQNYLELLLGTKLSVIFHSPYF